VLSVHGIRAPAQVADDVVESRVVYVGPEKVTRDATNRRRRPGFTAFAFVREEIV
jgi:hypothetical protein